MSNHANSTAHADAHEHHGPTLGTLIAIFAALLVLMVVTVGAALIPSINHNSYLANAINLGVASTKATLVVMFFMGAKYSSKLVQLYVLAGFVWFLTMFIVFTDYLSRRFEPVIGWEKEIPTGMRRFKEADSPESMAPGVEKMDTVPRY